MCRPTIGNWWLSAHILWPGQYTKFSELYPYNTKPLKLQMFRLGEHKHTNRQTYEHCQAHYLPAPLSYVAN